MTTVPTPTAAPCIWGELRDAAGPLPLTDVSVEAEVTGLVATTTLRQTFRNPREHTIEATYIFPLPDRAGVTSFTADLAGTIVEGRLREREQARAEYDAAMEAGQRAAIAEEERAGVFTLRVGNLGAGETAVITLVLTGPLSVADGVAELRFPLVVAPRYVPGEPLHGPQVGEGAGADTDQAPDASRITPPVLLPGQASPVRLSLRARLAAVPGLEPADVRSSLHPVTRSLNGGGVEVALHPGERMDRDVILRFPVAGLVARTVALVSADAGDAERGTWSVTVVPAAAAASPAPRDVVMVLDRSGSMGGWKIVAARRAAGRIIDTLGPDDRFAVLAFDNQVESAPALGAPDGLLAATDRARWAAVEWLSRLDARGGTEMLEPLRTAARLLTPAAEQARERALVLVTDGQVANEDSILSALAPALGGARVFTVGIDRAVNAAFLRRLADAGSGHSELVESEDRLDEVMAALQRRIAAPVATAVRVDAEGLTLIPDESVPSRAPDVFPGVPCVLTGRWERTGTTRPRATLRVRAEAAGGGSLDEMVEATAVDGPALRTVWARGRVRDLEDQYAVHASTPLADRIVRASLEHGVLSRFTAYVAVDRSRDRVVDAGVSVVQPVEMASGWVLASAMPMAGAEFPPSAMLMAGTDFPAVASGPAPAPRYRSMAPEGRARGVMQPAPMPRADAVPAPAAAPDIPRLVAELLEELVRGRGGVDALVARTDALADRLDADGAPAALVAALRALAAALRRGEGLDAAEATVRQAAGIPAARDASERRRWWRT